MRVALVCLGFLVAALLPFSAYAYISSDGDEFTVKYNSSGAVLTSIHRKHFIENNASGRIISKRLVIYIGVSCDAFSENYGDGTWEWANGGFVIHFQSKDFGFPRQEIDIPGMEKCRL